MKKLYLLIAILVLIGAGFFFLKSAARGTTKNPIACTMEAKLCLDGSYVGRGGPKCKFALCPSGQIKDENTASLNQRILNEGIYITPLQIVSDSRCPYGVQCIWAGEITIKVKLEKGGVSKEVEIKERGSVTFEGSTVSLVSIIPENKTQIPTLEKDYKFVFAVALVDSNINTGIR